MTPTNLQSIESSTEHQPRARVALSAALASGPSHAYLFRGPRGAGKAAVARAVAAEILATGAIDPDDARRRALLDPSPHPDLVWLTPRGAQHMVEEVRERVIRASSYRPFEAEKRVFVIEAAEQMRDESQNALLKTLEEPPDFVHILLLTSEPTALLETIASRCQPVDFAPLPPEAIEAALGTDAPAEELAAAARLSAGDVTRARFLLSDSGRSLRAAALEMDKDWQRVLKTAESAGEDAEATARELLDEEAEAGVKRSARDIGDEAKRAGRRRRTETLDLALELSASWFRDLAATASGAADVAFNLDRTDELQARAASLDPSRPRRAAELVQDTRRRLDLNVSEELALEALAFRLAAVFA
ncbi:MAG: polymerase subunit delta [Solirubrobacterales bacterium]|jgi:DNA polymerase-3 subunit delta'|nr:polymerase subunit delta [Solirubrobacterales bacterium]